MYYRNNFKNKFINLNGWNKIIFDKIIDFDSEIFKARQFNEFIPEFREIYPNNHTIKASIRGTLQELMELGLITRVSRGVYKNLAYSN